MDPQAHLDLGLSDLDTIPCPRFKWAENNFFPQNHTNVEKFSW